MRLRAFKLSLSEEIDPFCLGVGWAFNICPLRYVYVASITRNYVTLRYLRYVVDARITSNATALVTAHASYKGSVGLGYKVGQGLILRGGSREAARHVLQAEASNKRLLRGLSPIVYG